MSKSIITIFLNQNHTLDHTLNQSLALNHNHTLVLNPNLLHGYIIKK
ncbi:MAG: hypothetical protein AB1695_08715 [Stygiobacter sp.]